MSRPIARLPASVVPPPPLCSSHHSRCSARNIVSSQVAGPLIVADEIRITVFAFQLEISVVGRKPRVEHLRDGDAPVSKNQCAWRLLATMAGVALDTNTQPLFRHRIIIGLGRSRSA